METEKAHIWRTRQSKATYLPLDLIWEILLRLPVKSAVKFRCVSKLWSSVTTLPSFMSSFAARSRPRLLILSYYYEDDLFVFSIPQNHNSDNKPQLADSHVMTIPGWSIIDQFVHGLIYIIRFGIPQIWNPTTRDIATLPTPERGWRASTSFLGYDPIDGIYKVLYIPSHQGGIQPRVFTLNEPQKSWRAIQEIAQHCFLHPGKCINGVIYYGATLKRDDADHILVSFHVRSEKMSMIKLPWNHLASNTLLVPYHGKLACVISQDVDDITMWILEDAEKHVWSCKHVHLPFPREDPISQTPFFLRGVNDFGELIYVPLRLVINPLPILYFDPNRNSYRIVMVEGVADEQFRRRNRLGDNVPLHTLSASSNHIETLISL